MSSNKHNIKHILAINRKYNTIMTFTKVMIQIMINPFTPYIDAPPHSWKSILLFHAYYISDILFSTLVNELILTLLRLASDMHAVSGGVHLDPGIPKL